MFFTPISQCIRERAGKQLRDTIVITVTVRGNLSFRQFPEYFRQMGKKCFAVTVLVKFLEAVSIGDHRLFLFFRKIQRRFMGKLRLISEDRGHCAVKVLSHRLIISLVGDLDKTLNGFFIEGIHISLIIVPRAFRRNFQISIPNGFPVFCTFPLLKHPVIS